MDVGGGPHESLRHSKDAHVHKTRANPTPVRQTIRTSHRRISIWRGRHTLTRGRHQPTKTLKTSPPPNRLLFSNIHSDGKELRHLRTRVAGGRQSPTTLETTPCL